jgi:hypothetical protein
MLDDDIETLLARREPKIAKLAAQVIALVRERSDLAGKVRFGWGSVNFRHPKAGFVCAVFPMADHVDLIFERGRELDSPLLVDNGKVKQVRWIEFRPGKRLPRDEIGILLAEAIALRS